jgi:DNA-binding PadR family transcriptional regulator
MCDEMARTQLTDFELMVMLAILRLDGSAYGVPIAAEIEQTGDRPVARAVVYAALNRLEARRLVGSRVGEPTPERGGRGKRFYEVTGTGLRAVKSTRRALIALWHGIPQLGEV